MCVFRVLLFERAKSDQNALPFRGRLEEKLFPINHRFCDLKRKSMNFCETTDNKNVWKKYG